MSRPNLSNDKIIAKSRSIEGCLELSTDDLFRALGVTIVFDAIPDDQTTRGRRMFVALEKQLSEMICTSSTIRQAFNYSKRDETTLVSVIADIVAANLTGVPPFVIATLAYRLGLGKLCNDYWNEKNGT